jgi:methylglutaconyl-CoA hydratase
VTDTGLDVRRDGDVLRVTLARPERRNAFDAALIAALADAFADVGDARCVVLAGEGESFCAGADVEWQRASIDLSFDENVEDAMRLYRMLEAVDSCPAPVVARVQGYALGGGSGLVACCDIAVAGPDAVFGYSEVRLGIIPAVISPFVIPRIGAGAARRYFLTGERFDAETALRIGLVHEVADDLDGAVAAVVESLLQGGPEAVRAAKQLVREHPAGAATAEIAARRRTSPEGQEGLRAFLDKRPASWLGEGS